MTTKLTRADGYWEWPVDLGVALNGSQYENIFRH